jgi:hypothetical protein
VSEEAQDSCSDTSSEPEEEERSICLDNLATARKFVELVSAVRGALLGHAATVQNRVGDRVVVVVDSSSAVVTGDFHGVGLIVLLVRCTRKPRRLFQTYDAACKQEESGHAVKSRHDEARDGRNPDRSDADEGHEGGKGASESIVGSRRGHRVVHLPFGSANGEAEDDDGEDELEHASDQSCEHRGELLTENREFCGCVIEESISVADEGCLWECKSKTTMREHLIDVGKHCRGSMHHGMGHPARTLQTQIRPVTDGRSTRYLPSLFLMGV